jgi:hypothetical protein
MQGSADERFTSGMLPMAQAVAGCRKVQKCRPHRVEARRPGAARSKPDPWQVGFTRLAHSQSGEPARGGSGAGRPGRGAEETLTMMRRHSDGPPRIPSPIMAGRCLIKPGVETRPGDWCGQYPPLSWSGLIGPSGRRRTMLRPILRLIPRSSRGRKKTVCFICA